MRTLSLWSGMSIRPSIRGDCRSSVCSSTPLAVGLGEPSGLSCCAVEGVATSTAIKIATTPTTRRMRASNIVMGILLRGGRAVFPPRLARGSHLDALVIGGRPAPGAGAVTTRQYPLLVDLGDDLAVPGEQRFGRAHFRAQRQLSFEQPVGAVFLVFRAAAGDFRAATAGAKGAFVHLAARAEIADARILGRSKWAGVEAIAAADAQILGMEHDAVVARENTVHRTDRRAGRVSAVHAGHGHRALAGLAVVDGDDAPPVDAPGNLVLVLAGGDAGIAVDTAFGVTEKLHPSHGAPPHAALIWQRVALGSCMPVTGS